MFKKWELSSIKNNISVAYSSQGSYTGQLENWNRLVTVRRDSVISITLHQVY